MDKQEIRNITDAIYSAWYCGYIRCSEQSILFIIDAALEAADKED